MPQVFIISQVLPKPGKPLPDFSDLKRFTDQEFRYLTRGFVPFNKATELKIAKELADFKPDDFLVLNGSAALAALSMAVMKETVQLEKIRVLLYNAKNNTYGEDIIDGFVEI